MAIKAYVSTTVEDYRNLVEIGDDAGRCLGEVSFPAIHDEQEWEAAAAEALRSLGFRAVSGWEVDGTDAWTAVVEPLTVSEELG